MAASALGKAPELAVQALLRSGGSVRELRETHGVKSCRLPSSDLHGRAPTSTPAPPTSTTDTVLWGFKYDTALSKLGAELVRQCRGLVLANGGGCHWDIVARPFDKFFNAEEGGAAAVNWASARAYEKLDGALVFLYWFRGRWCVGTLGAINAGGPPPHQDPSQPAFATFRELFWHWFDRQGLALPTGDRARTLTWMFELVCPQTHVVVEHTRHGLFLLGAREASLAGTELLPGDARAVLVADGAAPAGVAHAAHPWPVVEERFGPGECTLAGLKATFLECPGRLQEGYVVVDGCFARVKVKHPGYVLLHHIGRDGILSPRRIVEVVRTGEAAEFLAYHPDRRPEVEPILRRFQALAQDLAAAWERIATLKKPKQQRIAANGTAVPECIMALRQGSVQSVAEYLAGPMPVRDLMKAIGVADTRVKKSKKQRRKQRERDQASLSGAESVRPIASFVHGSEDSLDKDVVYVVAEMPPTAACHAFCSADPTAENRNLVVIRDGRVVAAFKGAADEVNNALLRTIPLHPDNEGRRIDGLRAVPRDVPGKVASAVMAVLGVCIHNNSTAGAVRPRVKAALRSGVEAQLDVLGGLDMHALARGLGVDALKTLAFQMGQTMALTNGNELYTKREVALAFPPLRCLLAREPTSDQSLGALHAFVASFIDGCRRGAAPEQHEKDSGTHEAGLPTPPPPPPRGTRLVVIDFDGTLFRSPAPSSELWTREAVRFIKAPVHCEGLGWYHAEGSLSPPFVPQRPAALWFHAEVARVLREATADPRAVAVVLTGRSVGFRDRIAELLGSLSLAPDEIACKPEPGMDTLGFKQAYLAALVRRLAGKGGDGAGEGAAPPGAGVVEAHVWEDRPRHLPHLVAALRTAMTAPSGGAAAAVVVEGHLVSADGVTRLEVDVELPAVRGLLAAYNRRFPHSPRTLKETPLFEGVRLSVSSRRALLDAVPTPAGWTVHCSHITLRLLVPGRAGGKARKQRRQKKKGRDGGAGGAAAGVVEPLEAGVPVAIDVVAVGRSANALAVRVELTPPLPCQSQLPHITLATAPSQPPSASKQIRYWEGVGPPGEWPARARRLDGTTALFSRFSFA